MGAMGESTALETNPLLKSNGTTNSNQTSDYESASLTTIPLASHDDDEELGKDESILSQSSHAGTVGFWGSISIAVNTLTGPGMLQLPATFQRSGFIPTSACIVFVSCLCSMCALNFANVISKVPGNKNFTHEVEYSGVFQLFWGRNWFIITQTAYTACILCQLIASIVDVSQVVDTYMGSTFTQASSLQYSPPSSNRTLVYVNWDLDSACGDVIDSPTTTCVAFNRPTDSHLILTGGYILCFAVFVPLSLMDLKENIVWQIVGFIMLLVFSCQFALAFFSDYTRQLPDEHTNLTLWGHQWECLFGIVLFNFTVVTAVPAWLYEKHDKISVPQIIHFSNAGSAFLYIIVGGLGALSMPRVNDNMLSSMIAGAEGPGLQIGASLFAFFIIGLGIPLFSVLLRLNLTGNGLCSTKMGNVIAVWFPWCVSWMLYQGASVKELLSWGGAIFTSFVAFIAPLLLELHANYVSQTRGSISVFGGFIKTRESEFWALLVLSLLTIGAVALAITGLALAGIDTKSDIHAVSKLPPSL